MPRKKTKVCMACEQEKPCTAFYKSPNPLYDYVPLCNQCRNERLATYNKVAKTDGGGLWILLMELGIPFISSVWKETEEDLKGPFGRGGKPNSFVRYMEHLEESGIEVQGIWQSDVMLTDLVDFAPEAKEARKLQVEVDKLIKIWGRFTTKDGNIDQDAYLFLENSFENYTQELSEMDVNTENRYRDLCRCELQLRRANESNDANDISKAQDRLNKQLALLGMNDFKSNIKSEEQLAFEKRVAMIEFSKPAECEDLKKYLDMVGYDKEKAILMRSIRNAICGTRDYPDVSKET